MTTKTTTFRVGDRAVFNNDRSWVYTIVDGDKAMPITFTNSNKLELVERAHYAPDGVPMLAFTPDELMVLRELVFAVPPYSTEPDQLMRSTLLLKLGAIAAAQKEAP